MAYATIGDDARGSSTNVHHSTPARAREPVRAKRSNEARPLQRPIKLTDGAGPWHAELSRRLGHLWCSYGRESRASSRAAGCWVERCASTQTSSTGSTDVLRKTTDPTRAISRLRQNCNRLRPRARRWQLAHQLPWAVKGGADNSASVPDSALAADCHCPHCVDNDVDIHPRNTRRCR